MTNFTNENIQKYIDKFSNISQNYLRDEDQAVISVLQKIKLSTQDDDIIKKQTINIIKQLKSESGTLSFVDKLLQEYGLSSDEGILLMRISEALVRVCDDDTAMFLLRDKLIDGNWSSHAGQSNSFLVNRSTQALQLTKFWMDLTGKKEIKSNDISVINNILRLLSDPVVYNAFKQGMRYMGQHFVLGSDIKEALSKMKDYDNETTCFSFDMLGEAAYTSKDAERYFMAYKNATLNVAKDGPYNDVKHAPSISVKLSALHPRYEITHAKHCGPAIYAKLLELCIIAKEKNFGITIDAEECERLEISLIIIEQLCAAKELQNWHGLSIVVQAYQKRALAVIEHIIYIAKSHSRELMVRLVKGAYWDSEIKRAQELGVNDYPVFTRKENSDVNYIACAQTLVSAADNIYPQFATHNAQTAVCVAKIAQKNNSRFEFQRLYGMGEELHDLLTKKYAVKSRIYAPVGPHKDLLPYLVRRLLENGANSSFVNQLSNENLMIDTLVENPINIVKAHKQHRNLSIPSPADHLNNGRISAKGFDWMQLKKINAMNILLEKPSLVKACSVINGRKINGKIMERFSPFYKDIKIGEARHAVAEDIENAIKSAKESDWCNDYNAKDRALILEKVADGLEKNENELIQLLVWEAGKTIPDAIAEIREAVDFCRYYAQQAQSKLHRKPLGIVACISPWNFPLAIYLGQIVAALSMGNCVLAKPAEQTPLIAYKVNDILFKSGVPYDAFHLLIGDGAILGDALTLHPCVNAICFTGSTRTAKHIASNLAATNRADIPFIAETGGINAMIVDSTALMEQVIEDVVASAFQSAGQRCSACRLVCVQDDIADDFIEMLQGAMQSLEMGSPQSLSTDVGPVIDQSACNMIMQHVEDMKKHHLNIGAPPITGDVDNGYFAMPHAFEINKISDLKQEIFGPILHVVRYKAKDFDDAIYDINALGFGLTMGLHTRIDERVKNVSDIATVGNLYVNRNQIGAVVGVQPFGGEGLSGTGPKAGGPHYLNRLSKHIDNPIKEDISSDNKLLSNTESIYFLSAYDKDTLDQLSLLEKFAAYYKDKDLKIAKIYEDGCKAATSFLMSEQHLPGPTGEDNILSMHPRGKILCLGGNDIYDLHRQIALALSHYNKIILIQDADIIIDDFINETRYDKISCVGQQQLADIFQYVDGVACDGSMRLSIANKIAMLKGPIIPALSAFDDPERYIVERCVSINTTAAGGNASLLAAS